MKLLKFLETGMGTQIMDDCLWDSWTVNILVFVSSFLHNWSCVKYIRLRRVGLVRRIHTVNHTALLASLSSVLSASLQLGPRHSSSSPLCMKDSYCLFLLPEIMCLLCTWISPKRLSNLWPLVEECLQDSEFHSHSLNLWMLFALVNWKKIYSTT